MKSEMDISNFYKQFVEFRATLTKQGHPVPEDRREAQKFLQRLDDCYSEMMTSMANGTLLGVRYPGSLAAAYETASMYVVPAEKSKKPSGAPTSTYLANEEVAQAGTEQIEAWQQAAAEVQVGAERAVEEEAHRERREALRRTSY